MSTSDRTFFSRKAHNLREWITERSSILYRQQVVSYAAEKAGQKRLPRHSDSRLPAWLIGPPPESHRLGVIDDSACLGLTGERPAKPVGRVA